MSAPELPKIFSGKLITVIFWLFFMGSLTLFFNGFVQQRDNPNHALSAIDASGEVVLLRNRSGHYVAPGLINDHPVTFLLDTGATHVSIPASVADAVGLKKGRRAMVSTANGVIEVYQTNLDRVQLGGIRLQNIRASINPYMSDEVVLLGMSFMKHLEIVQRDGTLTLRLPVSG